MRELYDKRLLDKELLIKLFGTDNVITILKEMGDLNSDVNIDLLYKAKVRDIQSCDTTKPISYHGFLDLYRDVIENIFLYLTEYQDTLSHSEQKLYNSYYKYFLHSSKSSLRFVNTKLQEVCDKVFINTKHDINIIDNSLSKLRDKGDRIYDNLDHIGDPIISFFMEYLSSRANDADEFTKEMQEEVAQNILKSAYKNNIYAQKFFLKYTVHKYCEENKLPEIEVYILEDPKLLNEFSFKYIPIDINIIKNGTINDLATEIYNKLEQYQEYCKSTGLAIIENDPFTK